MKSLSKNPKKPCSKKSFFDAIICGIMFYKSEGKLIDKDKIKDAHGSNFYNDLLEIKHNIKLHRKIFGYFDRYFQVNEVLSKHNFFLKFFERQDVFSFLYKKGPGKKSSNKKPF